jgi:hypothetical protein
VHTPVIDPSGLDLSPWVRGWRSSPPPTPSPTRSYSSPNNADGAPLISYQQAQVWSRVRIVHCPRWQLPRRQLPPTMRPSTSRVVIVQWWCPRKEDESGAARGCRRHSARSNPTLRERRVSVHHANGTQPHSPRRTRTPSTLSQHEHGGALVASGLRVLGGEGLGPSSIAAFCAFG